MSLKRNLELAKIFYEMADILEIKNVKWKPQAYRVAAQTLESLHRDVKDIYKTKGFKEIENLPGIGEGIAKKIIEFIETGKIKKFEELKKELPAGLYEMMKVPGVGPKKASLFYNKLGIKNVSELRKAAKEHKLAELPGFKSRAEEKVLEGVNLLRGQRDKIPLKEAERIANRIARELKKLPYIDKVMVAGSIRRRKPLIRDIDLVVETKKPGKVLSKFVKMKFVKSILGQGEAKATIISKKGIQVDLRVFPHESFGSGLLYFTGSKQHSIWLRKIAIKKGYKLNEWGLFKGKKQIAGKTEKGIYAKLGLKFIKPEKRIGEEE